MDALCIAVTLIASGDGDGDDYMPTALHVPIGP
jgi:hypothetical protein